MRKDDVLKQLRGEIAAIESGLSVDVGERQRARREGKVRETSRRSDDNAKLYEYAADDSFALHEPDKPASGESKAESTEAAFKKIVAILNAGDKSERMLRSRLSRDGFKESTIEDAIERARVYRLIDDTRYADVLIRSRIAQGRGMKGIERELAENGIDVAEVPGWPFEYGLDDEGEIDRALELLSRKPPRAKNARDAAYRKLMQKGFGSAIASSAARIWEETLNR